MTLAELAPIDFELDGWLDVIEDVKQEYLSEAQKYPWVIGFSGGKDSTLMAHAVFQMLTEIKPSQRTRHVYIVSNDTLVESPLVIGHLNKVTSEIDRAAKSLNLPITVARTRPDPEKTFWVLLIGKGYPSPNSSMRWCTERLKINPTSTYIKNHVATSGAAILLLGVRKDESSTRAASINRRKNEIGSRLTPHTELSNAYVYRPIVNLTTDDVWEYLGSNLPPWGGTHKDLIQLYRDAEGGECPVVLSKAEAPGCGTGSSRFGCWTCTVVEKDKSLQGFVDSGKHKYTVLIEFRDWLKDIRKDPSMRAVERRNGSISFDLITGKHIPGPFTIKARQTILSRLLKVQEEFGDELISELEIDLIKRIWREDLS
jgi:DNA sulfur modification protein DndC